MRNISLLPLAALVAVAAGCGTEVKEQTSSSVPQRDLTLVTQTAQVEVASPLETQLLRTPSRSMHRSRMAARLAPVAPARPVLTAPQPAQPVPAASAAAAASNRELPPGKTVTVIPVSSGPSNGTDKGADAFPTEPGHTVRAHGGGTCRGGGRGPDIGMAPAPRPDFR